MLLRIVAVHVAVSSSLHCGVLLFLASIDMSYASLNITSVYSFLLASTYSARDAGSVCGLRTHQAHINYPSTDLSAKQISPSAIQKAHIKKNSPPHLHQANNPEQNVMTSCLRQQAFDGLQAAASLV
jgi:hypothetical protein